MRFPVISFIFASPIFCLKKSHSFSDRRSIHINALRKGFPFTSKGSTVGACELTPIAAISYLFIWRLVVIREIVSTVASHHCSASCSAHPASGKNVGYSALSWINIDPSKANNTDLTFVVPISMPKIHLLILAAPNIFKKP